MVRERSPRLSPLKRKITMSTNHLILNTTLNEIHSLSQSDHSAIGRMFLTRAIEIVAVIIEVATIAFAAIEFAYACGKQLIISFSQMGLKIFPKADRLKEYANWPSAINEVIFNARRIASLIGGLASTIFFGIFISPEANFNIHLKLDLITDDLATKSKNTLTAKLEIEKEKVRSEHLAILETSNEREIAKVNKYLADLLKVSDLLRIGCPQPKISADVPFKLPNQA
jgi:hypothetical protein